MSKTVLVLGAGASRPFGLPTSPELTSIILGGPEGDQVLRDLDLKRRDIIRFLDGRNPDPTTGAGQLHRKLRNWAGEHENTNPEIPYGLDVSTHLVNLMMGEREAEQHGKNFRSAMRGLQNRSPDAFIKLIHHREPTWEQLALFAIAGIIALCERVDRLSRDWQQQVIPYLMGDPNHRFQLTHVINFNYDRAFDHAIEHACWGKHGHTAKADELRALMKIYHPYGYLGPTKGITQPGELKYGDHTTSGMSAGNLKLARDSNLEIRQVIENFIVGADRVIFFGFAFWDENVDYFTPLKGRQRIVHSTAYGLPNKYRKRAEQQIGPIEWGDPGHKIDSFLNEFDLF